MTEILYLRSNEVADVATMSEYVDAVRQGYVERGRGAILEPRAKLYDTDPESFLMYYGALLTGIGVMGTFSYVTGFSGGGSWFLTYLVDTDTGEPLSIIDSPSINPYKTGATGAVGVDALARSDATTVGIVGSGTQARGQLLGTATVRDLTDVTVYSPTASHRESFVDSMGERVDATVRAVDTVDAAVTDQDIVITATNATEPVFDGRLLSPGTHVTAMGQSHPERRELDETTVANSRYVGDHQERVETSSGSYLQARATGAIDDDHFHAELGDVVAGAAPGRTDEEKITVFDSGGTGIETVAASYMVYARASERARGTTLTLTPGRAGFEL